MANWHTCCDGLVIFSPPIPPPPHSDMRILTFLAVRILQKVLFFLPMNITREERR